MVPLSSTGVAVARNHVLVAAGSMVIDGVPPELARGYRWPTRPEATRAAGPRLTAVLESVRKGGS